MFGASIALLPLAVVNALTSRRGYAIRTGIAYGPNPRQRLDVYTPDNAGEGAPVVVFFHGGSWDRGDGGSYLFVGQALASAGIVAVLPTYRLYPEVVFPAFVHDGGEAVAWAHRVLPRAPLIVAGHSAGAHIAALLNFDPHYLAEAGVPRSAIAGAIGIAGPYDFLPLKERYRRIFPEPLLADSQPITRVDGTAAPMLLLTGADDRTVKPGNTTRLADAIRARGGEVSVRVYPGVGHLGPLVALAKVLPWPKPPVRRDMVAFVRDVTGR
jgi:acetyl esterase/lipase